MTHFETPPATAQVEVFDRSHGLHGNPTAHYSVTWPNDKTGGALRSRRRAQVGYRDKTSDGALYALGRRFPRTVWVVSHGGITENYDGSKAEFTAVRDHAREPVPVIFRAEKSGTYKGEVTAVFPTQTGTNDFWTCAIYARNGQHGSGSRDWYNTTRPALPSEYATLKRELESAPFNYNLQVRKKWSPAFDDERRAALM